MSYAFVQDTSNASAAGTSSLSAGAINVTAGDALVIAVFMITDHTVTLTGNSNTYNLVDDTHGLQTFYVQNANGGSTNVNASASGNIGGIYVAEYSGIATTSALLAHIAQDQVGTQGTGTDGITTGTTSVTVPGGALAWGFSFDQPGASDGTNSFGTGFTGRTKCWAALGAGGGTDVSGYPEDRRLTVNGSYAATWTSSSSNHFDTVYQGLIVLAETQTPIIGQIMT